MLHAISHARWIRYLGPGWHDFSTGFLSCLELFSAKQSKTKWFYSGIPLKSCSQIGLKWDGAKNIGFTWLHLVLVGSTWGYMRTYFKELYIWSYFGLPKLFMEPKAKKWLHLWSEATSKRTLNLHQWFVCAYKIVLSLKKITSTCFGQDYSFF